MDALKTVFVVPAFCPDHDVLLSPPIELTHLAGVRTSPITIELANAVPLTVQSVSADTVRHWESTTNESCIAGCPTVPPSHVIAPVQLMGLCIYQLEIFFDASSFDFVLHSQTPSPVAASSSNGSARKKLVVAEYGTALVPALRPAALDWPLQPCGMPFVYQSQEQQAALLHNTNSRYDVIRLLIQWVVESYYERSMTTIANTIGTFSDRLKFEFDSFLCAVGRGCASLQEYPLSDAERPLYVARPTVGGTYQVVLELPLLLDQRDVLDMRCEVFIDLFLKLSQQEQLHRLPRLAMGWRYRVAIEAGKGLFQVHSEQLTFSCQPSSAQGGDGSSSDDDDRWALFLLRSVDTSGGTSASGDDLRPPSYANYSAQRNATLMEFIPELESWLLRMFEEPQHFLELIHALTQHFGLPLQWNVVALHKNAVTNNKAVTSFRPPSHRSSPGAVPPQSSSSKRSFPKFASFLCMDRATSTSFSLQVTYQGLKRLPEVALQSTLHILTSNNRPLRVNIALSELALRLDEERQTGFDVLVMAEAIHEAVHTRFADVQRVIQTLETTATAPQQ